MLVGVRGLQGAEVGALDVLDEGKLEQLLVSGLADEGGDGGQAREAGGLQPPLARDEVYWPGYADCATTRGWITPCSRMELASSSSSVGSRRVRGCRGLRPMADTGNWVTPALVSETGMRASRPRPRPRLGIFYSIPLQQLLRQRLVRQAAGRAGGIG